ncbi:hypothetical protein [Amnibacterium endophyticum]|uniref:Gram-positive cocci surface proteins LPxTG domain-containing protein n=1 Tax=Amnibacterium endophyticum TaxID=2109337 RepID=A0ABW4LGV7_9MICO
MTALLTAQPALVVLATASTDDTSKAGTAITIIGGIVLVVALVIGALVLFRRRSR